jgi:aminoethylphosphonate catabolism LysR family transcriptional regulator
MRYAQLRAFHFVALHGGFSRAAQAMFLTQPAVSDQVGRLEREHDLLLFKRDRKRVQLTQVGEKLFTLTRQMFEIEDQIAEALSESRTEIEGTLRIVADSTFHLTEILKQFRLAYPGVFVSIRSGNTLAVLDALRDYQAEIGVAGSIGQSSEFQQVNLGQTPIVAFASNLYFPKEKTKLRLADLADVPLVYRESGSTTRQNVEMAAAKHGIKLAPAIEAEGRDAVREIVAAGIGVGFVSLAEFGEDARIRSLPVSGLNIDMDEKLICFSQRRDVRIIRSFMDLAAHYLTAPSKV